MNRSPDVKSSLVLNHLNTRNKSKPFSVNANRLHIGQFFPLSWAQQRLWFLEQLEDLGAAYHIPAVLRLQGELDREALQRSLDEILARHEALRTVFVRKENGEPVQRILPEQPFALAYHDLSQLAEAEKEQARASLTEETLHRPFDLTQDILIRASLAKLGEQDHVLNLCMHHIVSDGWSMGVLTRELAALYGAFSQGQENPLPALPIQYVDYAQWQRQWLSGERLKEQVSFWKEELSGAPSLLELPTDHPRPQVQSFAGSMVPFELDEEITQGLNALARRHGATLFMVLQAGFAVLLGRLSGQDDVVVGTPVANRRRSELEGLIGFFVNTLALRTRLDGQATVAELLAQVKDRTLAGFGHQDVPFEQVVEAVSPERDMSHSPLFQVMLALQNNAEVELKLPGLTLGLEEANHETTHFDLTLSLGEAEGRLQGMVEYSTVLFERATVERWLGHLKVLLSAMVADEACTLANLPLLTEPEREQIIHGFNATRAEYPRQALIHELFEQQVERTPDAVAVQYEGEELTYAQLNAKANQLAHRLRAMRDASGDPVIKPDALVAISVERSLEMVVGLLGILKAGAAYVPIDPSYPAERLRYVLQDSRPVAFLTHGLIPAALRDQLQDVVGGVPVIELDASSELWQEPGRENLSSASMGLQPSHLAYVIYTSGSTGKPKGVMVEHQNVTRLFAATQDWFHFGSEDVWTLFHSFAFDFSVWEIWGALLHGGRLVVVPYLVSRSPDVFYGLLCDEGVTVLNQTPSAFRQLMAAQETAETQRHCLRTVIFGGEALEPTMLGPWYERAQNRDTQLVNMYGITETTVHVTYRPLNAEDVTRGNSSPIGVHIPDLRVYVLDANRQPVPLGVTGELYVGGAGVARGYLNREELTAERFVNDPFSEEPGARMYRTGDLGRRQADGSLEYQGRNDFQVKIRGLRIELGEIEARLAELPAVREVVVLAREAGRTEPGRGEGTGSTSGTGVTGDRRLVAYWVARDGLPETDVPTVEELRDHLKAELPAYMVPSAFVKLEAMPLTPNGKVDRRALPAPDAEALVTHAYEAPQGPVEEVLAGIWQDLLGVERVGRHDSFFDLGGHSLLLLRLQHRIKGRIKYVRIADILENKTIYQQARIIESKPIVFTHPEKNLVTLKKGSGEISIFLVHEISGDILSYIEFSRSFSEKVTVFGVRAQEFDGHDLFSMSLPDIARCHAKEIKAVQPCGPYRLAGWSSGGLFAYEIANQLMKSGEDVGFVGAIDTHLYSSSDWNDITDLDILVHFIHSHNISIPEFVLQKIKHDTNICDMISVFSDHDLMPSGFDIHEIKHRVMTYRALYDACRSYEIRRLFMRVCLFTVQDYNGCGAVYGWKRCAGERPDIVYIKGDHENVMLLPNVSDLALEVEKKL